MVKRCQWLTADGTSRCGCASDHLAPIPWRSVACGAVLVGAQAAELDVIEYAAVNGQEALGPSGLA